MHEVSLVSALVERVEVLATEKGFSKVESVLLGVGNSSGVDTSSLSFCFPEVVRGSVLDGALLRMIERDGCDLTLVELDVE